MPDEIIRIKGRTFALILKSKEIQKRISLLAKKIERDFSGKSPLLISVLQGSFYFTSDLTRNMKPGYDIHYVKVSSYGGRMKSTGRISALNPVPSSVHNRNVLLIDDIADTGRTISFLRQKILSLKPLSLKIAVLLHKPDNMKFHVAVDYTGFRIGNLFVVGYGLDYSGEGRTLRDIYALKPC